MPGLGTLINAAGICAGVTIGIVFSRHITMELRKSLLTTTGVITMFMGIAGAMAAMLQIRQGELISSSSMMLLVTFALGTLIGELINIQGLIEKLGKWLQQKSGSNGDGEFTTAFVTASMTVSIGAMAIIGAINDGANGDLSMLLFKTAFDSIVLIAVAAALGKGCIFSVIPVVAIQGVITLSARFAAPYITTAALTNLSLSGAILVFCVGINLVWKNKIRLLNMVPAMVLAVAWAYLPIPI